MNSAGRFPADVICIRISQIKGNNMPGRNPDVYKNKNKQTKIRQKMGRGQTVFLIYMPVLQVLLQLA